MINGKLSMDEIKSYVVLVPHDGFDKDTVVYKYRQLNDRALKGLVMSHAYFAQAAAFNDPFEKKSFDDLNIDTTGYDRVEAVKTVNHLFTDCGIFCLCETADNLHMWSFYGIDEKSCGLGGFAIGYRLESLLKNLEPCTLGEEEITPRWKYAYRVKYDEKPESIVFSNLLDNRDYQISGEEERNMFAHKSIAFIAEREIRIVVGQGVSKKRVGHGLYVHQPEDIVEIVFGEDFTAENETVVRHILEGREIRYRRAKRISGAYNIDIVEA